MLDLREVELRIVVAEGVLSRSEADALGEEARLKNQSPLALLVERGRISDDSFQSFLAAALNDSTLRAAAEDGSANTVPMVSPPAASAEPAFPVTAWDRYVNVRFLGQGGMGTVFLAIDARLRREVAIKFVRGDDFEHVRRLVVEARTQARVTHERICKVYEVGEVKGKVYIAMQYIHGKTLGSLTGELTLEQKVMLIRGAAEGIHEAHREGIIHRDIKPSNIMVERTDDGEFRPYVMDFGLARSAQEAGATLSGAVLGTPRYMSPEQAHGDTAKLDRRADIYSLGATLYHLLTGEPPIPGETAAEVIHNLVTMEPRPLRALDPNIPIDLEAIVLKCLEKDRSARYDSARALTDDLGRFLNGEPVLARPAGVWYRLRKRIAKHRRLVAAGAIGLVLLLIAVGWGLKTRSEASERERLARRFTEKVEQIEAKARYSALSPIHDIRGDQAQIRKVMSELDGEIRQAGAIATGPGHYALGRGYLALDDDAKAREELESAWQEGFREPRVAYALALALGHLYQQNLLAAERIEDNELRDAKKREIEKQHRDPALAYLEASKGAEVPSIEYVAALVAYYEGRFEEALKNLDSIGNGLPGFYEAPELRGDILLAQALAFRHQGMVEQARHAFEEGRKAYATAASVGESVPALYTSLGELEYAALVMELYGHGGVIPVSDHALVAVANALTTKPDHYDALVLKARIQRSLAEYNDHQGSRVEDLLAKAISDAQRAVAVYPEKPQARLELAEIYRQWGMTRRGRDQDPSEQLHLAIVTSESILPQDRDAAYYANLGLIFTIWADYGGDSAAAQEKRGKAIAAYTRALELDQRMDNVWINLGATLFKRAAQPHAKDPDADLQQALTAFDKAKSLNSEQYVPYFYEGEARELMAQRARALGLDPDPELTRSLDSYKKGLALNNGIPNFHNGIGTDLMDMAQAAWDRGADPLPLLDQARAAFEQAISVAHDQGNGYGNIAAVFAQRAWFQHARGEDPSASVGAAVEALNRAIKQVPDRVALWANLGKVHAIQAAYELEHGHEPEPSLGRALAALHTALEKNPDDPDAQFYLGETRAILAQFRTRQKQAKAADFADAAHAYQKAIDLDPENLDHQVAFGHFWRLLAIFQRDTGEDAGSSLAIGLVVANQVLARRPAWPDALVLRASLTLLQAQASTGAVERRTLATGSSEDFTKALASNPALAPVWRGQAVAAQQVAVAAG